MSSQDISSTPVSKSVSKCRLILSYQENKEIYNIVQQNPLKIAALHSFAKEERLCN